MNFKVGDIVKYIGEDEFVSPVNGEIMKSGVVGEIHYIDINNRCTLDCGLSFSPIDLIHVELQQFEIGDVVKYLGIGTRIFPFNTTGEVVEVNDLNIKIITDIVEFKKISVNVKFLELVSVPFKSSQKTKCDCDLFKVLMVTGCKNPNHY